MKSRSLPRAKKFPLKVSAVPIKWILARSVNWYQLAPQGLIKPSDVEVFQLPVKPANKKTANDAT